MRFNRDDSVQHERIPHSTFNFSLHSSIIFDCPLSEFVSNLEYSEKPQISFLMIFHIFLMLFHDTLQHEIYFAKLGHPRAFGRQIPCSNIFVHHDVLPLPKLVPSLTGLNNILSIHMIHILPFDLCLILPPLSLTLLNQASHQQFLTIILLSFLIAFNNTSISYLWFDSLL